MRSKTRIIFLTDIKVMQKYFDESYTKNEILLKLGCSPNSGSMRQKLNERITLDNIDLTKFNENNKEFIRKRNSKNTKIPLSDILVGNSTYTNMTLLKKRLIQEGLLEYKCVNCGNIGIWNGKKLTLQIDHINGVHNDHRIENLRFLCPNCHAQTETFSGKNINKY